MIVNYKYHIASLVAVFLALGIGIIIGSSVLGECLVRNIVAEQERLISRLEEDYDGLKSELNISRQEIKRQKAIIEDYQRYAEDTLPQILKDQLKGKKVALVVGPLAKGPNAEPIRKGLELAGAELLLDWSLEEVCALVEQQVMANSVTYLETGEFFSVDTVVIMGQDKHDQELIAKIKDCKIPVHAYLNEQNNLLAGEIPGLVSLIFQIAGQQ